MNENIKTDIDKKQIFKYIYEEKIWKHKIRNNAIVKQKNILFLKMLFKIISIFLLLSCKNIVLNIKLKENCYLANGCEFGPKIKDETTILRINCNDHLVKYDFSLFNRSNEMCRLKQPTARTIIMSIRANKKNSILGINSDLLKLVEYSMLYFQLFGLFLQYFHFKGIRVDTKIDTKLKIGISFEISQTKLYFYDKHNQLINDW